jgi:hypothetical protein
MSDTGARIAQAMTDTGTPPKVGHLPLQDWGYYNCPAIPFWADANGNPDAKRAAQTVDRLKKRGQEPAAAYAKLSTKYTIGGNADITAYEFLYGSKPGQLPNPASPLCHLPLDNAGQFTLPWTNYENVYTDSLDLRDPFADTLKSSHKDVATRSFWPTIAYFGIPYNLLLLSKINAKRAVELKAEFGGVWTAEGMDAKVAAGLAYEIDTRIIEGVESYTPQGGAVRFVPGCITLLAQDAQTKALTPTAIKLFTTDASDETRVYAKGGNAWIYALQAAKTSITVWGIWLGHVFHWHIPTAAMQMTMYNALPADHPLWTLLAPQSDWLIDFDYVLLQVPGVFDQISPPTPIAGPMPLLALLDRYAAGRDFFDLDPLRELKKQGLDGKDFTVKKDWDAYPVAGYLVNIWKICQGFVKVVVDQLYKSDKEVASDTGLKAWIDASKDPKNGNVKLPDITTRALLVELLTSLLYRVTAHGAGSLSSVVNPTLAFISNFPPCLQSKDMPQPNVELSDGDLLKRMPYTGTMGTMATFYFTFAYSEPYVPAIPKGGDNLDPYWPVPGTPSDQACNAALLQYRANIRSFVTTYTNNWNDELARIGGVPTAPVPSYAENQAEQWPRSIEI